MITTPITGSIHEQNTVPDTSQGIPDVLNVSPAGANTMPNSSFGMSSCSFVHESTTSNSPNALIAIVHQIPYL